MLLFIIYTHTHTHTQEHCCVLYTIVGWDSIVGEWSRVEGHSSDPDPNDPYGNHVYCNI